MNKCNKNLGFAKIWMIEVVILDILMSRDKLICVFNEDRQVSLTVILAKKEVSEFVQRWQVLKKISGINSFLLDALNKSKLIFDSLHFEDNL